jgi:hypothetical protein
MAKMRTGALRKLHADLGKILEDYDASCAEQSATDEEDDAPTAQAKLARGHAQDAALHGGRELSMEEAFPGFNRRPKY